MAIQYDKQVRVDQATLEGLLEVVAAVPVVANRASAVAYLLDYWRANNNHNRTTQPRESVPVQATVTPTAKPQRPTRAVNAFDALVS